MSTREQVIELVNLMTEEQLQGFVLMFQGVLPQAELPNAETKAVMDEIEQGKNLSKAFSSVKDLMEDLNADD